MGLFFRANVLTRAYFPNAKPFLGERFHQYVYNTYQGLYGHALLCLVMIKIKTDFPISYSITSNGHMTQW